MDFNNAVQRELLRYIARIRADALVIRALRTYIRTIQGASFPTRAAMESTLLVMAKAVEAEQIPACLSACDLMARRICHDEGDASAEQTYLAVLDVLQAHPRTMQATVSHPCPMASMVEGIYPLFTQKGLFVEVLTALCAVDHPGTAMQVVEYLRGTRQYHITERTFASAAFVAARAVADLADGAQTKAVLDHQLTELRRIFGIYDVSRADIAQFADSYARIEEGGKALNQQYQSLQEQATAVAMLIQDLDERVTGAMLRVQDQTQAVLRDQAARIEGELTRKYGGFEERIQRMLEQAGAPAQAEEEEGGETPPKKGTKKAAATPPLPPNLWSALLNQSARGVTMEDSPEAIHPSVPLLDDPAPILDRCRRMLAGKDATAIYHSQFDTMAKLVLMGNPVMLVGPSGAGKTHSIRQLAGLMGLTYYNLSYINEEYKLTGFKDANSHFDVTAFYMAYKYGGLCFFDELDNSHPGAVLLLNEFLGTKMGASFIFPNREVVRQHKYFRLIAASNTWGNGADRIHNVRAKLDGATTNRFTAIAYDYDARVEKRLCPDEALLSFLRAYRSALNALDVPQPVTYRDVEDMFRFVSEGVFTIQEAMVLKLVKNARVELLQKIAKSVEESSALMGPNNPNLSAFLALVSARGKVAGAAPLPTV